MVDDQILSVDNHDWCTDPSCKSCKGEDAPDVYQVTPALRGLDGKKIGRNDPCPCGSGRKFKKCCWDKVD